MKLIFEEVAEKKYITEEVDGKKQLYIEGVYLQSEIPNRNRRKYPKEILEKEVMRYIKEKVEDNRAWGELGHPDSPNINLDRACIRTVSLVQEGNDWIGKSRVLNTKHGNVVRALIEDGGNLGVSSRGCGTMIKESTSGLSIVQGDFRLATAADVVADPSAPNAFVNGIMEQKEWVWDNGIIKEADISAIYKDIKKAKRLQLEETFLNSFKKFLSKL